MEHVSVTSFEKLPDFVFRSEFGSLCSISVMSDAGDDHRNDFSVMSTVDRIIPAIPKTPKESESSKQRQRDHTVRADELDRPLDISAYGCFMTELLRICVARDRRICVLIPFPEGIPNALKVRPSDFSSLSFSPADDHAIQRKCSGARIFESVKLNN